MSWIVRLALCGICVLPWAAGADTVRVAVAANFAPTLQALAAGFEAASGHRLLIASASTGKHYAQIRNGAAFDVFLAADVERPRRLEREGLGVPGSRFDYAIGRLALWVPGAARIDDPQALLASVPPRRLAIASPRLAPYGVAAREVLDGWGLWSRLQPRLVRGENIAQAFQFVATGNAAAGLVALSQLLTFTDATPDSYRVIDGAAHAPIRQQALLLRRGAAAEAFVAYLRGDAATALIRAAGYALPGDR